MGKILLVDFNFSGKYILVVGGGEESYRKVLKFMEAQPKIQVVSKSFSSGMLRLCESGKIERVKSEVKDAEAFLRGFNPKPDLVIAATDNQKFNEELALKAKALGCLVYTLDNPKISDFTLPAATKIGEVKVAISTGGKSPAVAGILRRRIEKTITEEDLLQIRLQQEIRGLLKKEIPDQKTRRKIVFQILDNKRVLRLLKEGKFNEALEEAFKMVEKHKTAVKSLENSTKIIKAQEE